MITRSSRLEKRAIHKIQIIAISGVPGVGKTHVAARLAKQIDAELISITALVKARAIPYTWDRARRTRAVTVRDVQRVIDRIIRKHGQYVVEGLLAHLLRANVVFVLRCDPAVLRKRLATRKWGKRKIDENVQAEMLDIITAEADTSAARRKARLYEIDTTHKAPVQTANTMAKILKSAAYAKKFRPGKIRWLRPKQIRI